jgi:hypothetical protein
MDQIRHSETVELTVTVDFRTTGTCGSKLLAYIDRVAGFGAGDLTEE